MGSIDWPTTFDRTDPTRRERCRKFDSTIGSTTSDIATEMDRMGVDDWRASTGSGGAHVKSNGLPKASANPDDPGFALRWSDDGDQFAVACDAYTRLCDNAREVYLWVNETRMRSQRAVVTGQSEFAAAQLPSGQEETVAADPPAHKVLGVDRNAPEAVVKGAARSLKAEKHPDRGGSEEEFKRVVNAEESLLG
jgi:hypothetical protein